MRRPDGTDFRERRSFKTRAEAEEELSARGFEAKNRRVKLLDLTDNQREDAAKTSLQLGHQHPDVVFSNYRNIRNMAGRNATEKLAIKYWAIQPSNGPVPETDVAAK